MDKIAVRHTAVKNGWWSISIGLLAGVIMLAGLWESAAKAKPVRKDGKIYACYRVKGKPRGNMRLLFKGKHCRRGERRVVWTARAKRQFEGGDSGGQASSPPDPAIAALSARVDGLELKTASLEKKVEDSNASIATLTTKVAALELGAADLGDTVDALCGQLATVTTRWNELREVVGGLELVGVVSGLLQIPSLPLALEPFVCT